MQSDPSREIKCLFGERVRQLRKERGLSQGALASLCTLDRTYIGGLERAERNVSLVNISKIAAAFGIAISELFEFPNER